MNHQYNHHSGSSLLVVDEHQTEDPQASKENCETKENPHNWTNEAQVVAIHI